jgi:hypothetical protein
VIGEDFWKGAMAIQAADKKKLAIFALETD